MVFNGYGNMNKEGNSHAKGVVHDIRRTIN
jgi:hypothetical protein